MAVAALSQVASWTPKAINERLREWTDSLVARTAALGYTAPQTSQRAGHVIGLRSERGLRPGLAAALADRGIFVSIRGDCIQVAPHLHTAVEDIDRFAAVLAALTQ